MDYIIQQAGWWCRFGEVLNAPNYSLAHTHFARAAAGGDAHGVYNLGTLHAQGLGVRRDAKVR